MDLVEGGILLTTNDITPDYSSRPALSSLALYLWAMYVSGHHQIIGVSASLEEEFRHFVSEGEAVVAHNAVVLPRMASIIINFMALFFVVGVVAGLILYGGNALTVDWASYDLRNVDLWDLFITLLALLVLGSVSIIRTGSILHTLRQVSVLWQAVSQLWRHKDTEE
jgi:hypothetical protein